MEDLEEAEVVSEEDRGRGFARDAGSMRVVLERLFLCSTSGGVLSGGWLNVLVMGGRLEVGTGGGVWGGVWLGALSGLVEEESFLVKE